LVWNDFDVLDAILTPKWRLSGASKGGFDQGGGSTHQPSLKVKGKVKAASVVTLLGGGRHSTRHPDKAPAMRISRPAPEILIVQDPATRPRVLGVVCAAVGCATAYLAGSLGGSSAWIGVTVGTLIALLGIVALRGIASQTVTFDRPAGLVRVRTQHLLGVSAILHRLADVRDVVLERQLIGDERNLYRTAFVMRDGTHRGWTPTALGDSYADLAAAVRAMREFLGTAASATAPDGTVAIPATGNDLTR
jgi:hypothetical protein